MARSVRVTVDGAVLEAPEGTPLLQAMLDAGLDIPHYCYHPKLSIDGSCRLCQVEIEGMPKLQISCYTPVRDGMVVRTQTPEVARTRQGVLELLLLNHPLDCPICDKAGECWLQNYAFRFGSHFARTVEPRRKHGKRLDIGERMLLDQERCILCRRCVRFCREITGTGELAVFKLGDRSLLDIYDQRLDNDYSICTADICPVGALESKDFHHRMRVWFLRETASVCPGCANGCNIMIGERGNRIWRLTPRRNDAVNDTWMCDWGRLNYSFPQAPQRLLSPMVAEGGRLAAVSWEQALERCAAELRRFVARHGGSSVGAVASPHLTNEELFRFGQLLAALGVETSAAPVRRGRFDNLLIKAEKAANAAGARLLGLARGSDDGLKALCDGIERGRLKALYLCGEDLFEVLGPERAQRLLSSLELVIFQGLALLPALSGAAVVFPATTFAEKEGSFTNHAGRVQRIWRALQPAPGWLCDGEIFSRLRSALCGERDTFDPAEVFQEMAAAAAPFSGLTLEQLGTAGVPAANGAAAP